MQLQQPRAANSSPSSVAFARVKNLKEYLEDLITTQSKNNNLWTHDSFEDEIWLKIGVCTSITNYKSTLVYFQEMCSGIPSILGGEVNERKFHIKFEVCQS